jgi:D-alanyl-D-alanine carboxypeptidase
MDLFTCKKLGVAAALMSMAASANGIGQPDRPAGTPLARCIASEANELDFSGAISIVQPQGTTTWERGVLAEAGSPGIGGESRFNLASASKMFTAVAVAQLIDAGKVRLDDAIGVHVKGLTPEAAAVTVRQLLTHSSGLGNFFAPQNLPAIEKARNASDLLPLVVTDKPSYPPGARFQYSNTGFLLLGILIERVSGQTYGQYLDQHVFGPARMVATGMDPGPASTQAVGMTTRQGPLRPAREAALRGNPAGGSYSTAADMQRFLAALLGRQLTTAAMLKELISPQIMAAQAKEGSPQLEYGLGFGVGVVQGRRWFGHNGGAPGVNVEAAVYPDDGTAVVVMSNRDPPAATMLFRKLRAMLFDPGLVESCAIAR